MVGNYFGSGVWHYLELETSHHWIIYTERSVDNPVPQHPAKILVVDDDPEVCEAIAAVLAEEHPLIQETLNYTGYNGTICSVWQGM